MTGRLNGEGRGQFLGEFDSDDRILVVYKDGNYALTNYELINRYEPDEIYLIQKFYPEQVLNCVYLDGKSKNYFVKRFKIETTTLDKKFLFIGEAKGSSLTLASTDSKSGASFFTEDKKKNKQEWLLTFDDFMEVQGWKTVGSRLASEPVKKITPVGERIGAAPQVTQNVVQQFEEETRDKNSKDQLNLL